MAGNHGLMFGSCVAQRVSLRNDTPVWKGGVKNSLKDGKKGKIRRDKLRNLEFFSPLVGKCSEYQLSIALHHGVIQVVLNTCFSKGIPSFDYGHGCGASESPLAGSSICDIVLLKTTSLRHNILHRAGSRVQVQVT